MGLGYFFVWIVFGMAAFPLGVALAGVEMQVPPLARAVPVAAGPGTAWRQGVRLGLHCSRCCANLMAILLVIGIMDLRGMAVVTAAVTGERLAPAGERLARAIGAVVVAAGLALIVRAAGLE